MKQKIIEKQYVPEETEKIYFQPDSAAWIKKGIYSVIYPGKVTLFFCKII